MESQVQQNVFETFQKNHKNITTVLFYYMCNVCMISLNNNRKTKIFERFLKMVLKCYDERFKNILTV